MRARRKISFAEVYEFTGDGIEAMNWAGAINAKLFAEPANPEAEPKFVENPLFVRLGHENDPGAGLFIKTLNGEVKVNTGDFIICGVEGEFYPCSPSVFEKTWEIIGE